MTTLLSRSQFFLIPWIVAAFGLAAAVGLLSAQAQPPAGQQANLDASAKEANRSASMPQEIPTGISATNGATVVDLGGAEWIWSPAFTKDEVPTGDCYFRKTFIVADVKRAEIHIAADNRYELFINGKAVGQGEDWRAMDVYDLAPHLVAGQNTIAVRATNSDAGAAGLVARILLEEKSGKKSEYSTDDSWITSVTAADRWNVADFPDSDWLAAKSYGPLGIALPWGNEVILAALGTQFYLADREFAVEKLIDGEATGSLIAMAFDYTGDLFVSREAGPLLRLRDTNGDGKHDKVTTFCKKIESAQGILPLGQQVLAVGIGPNGGGMYALRDTDHDGTADDVRNVLRFRGSVGEHGAHAIRLGRDGMLYVMVGNHAQVDAPLVPSSPYHHPYEGDVVRPRYEDPHGHAAGVPAPGGTVVRTNPAGTRVELFAGGLRNAYDFAFLPDGELVTYDADMEWDMGAPWYRPTRINHVPAGAELGWRSGWAKWPSYYVDSLPAVLDIGPGSPTGVEVYDHVNFPVRYHGALFVADWARGRIDSVRFERKGASYTAKAEPFLEGTPLSVTDLAVGPDGALYFCTGGRGTAGGVYRVQYTGKVPPEVSELGRGIDRALNQPQLDAPWAQSRIAAVRQQLGRAWARSLENTARSTTETVARRLRALDLMQLYGPRPDVELLIGLSRDVRPSVRARAASLLAIHSASQSRTQIAERLRAATEDVDPWVRRVACEAIARGRLNVPAGVIIARLDDDDRFVRFAARRALEQMPTDQWQDAVMKSPRTRVFLGGAVGLLTVAPSGPTAAAVLDRCVRMIGGEISDPRHRQGFISDTDFIDLLRTAEIALLRGGIGPPPPQQVGRALTDAEQAATALSRELLREFPTKNAVMNRELARLLVAVQVPEAAALFAKHLARADVPQSEKLHIAACASRLTTGWDRSSKLAMIEFLDAARSQEGGYSIPAYIEQFTRQFLKTLTPGEQFQILSAAADWPLTALSMLATMPKAPHTAMLAQLREIDSQLTGRTDDAIARLRVGIVAVLGRSGEEASLAYLHEIYGNDPNRRATVAMSLTQHPNAENWPILVDSLKIIEGVVAEEVIAALLKVKLAPQEPAGYRYAIMLGLRSRESTARAVVRLLNHWADQVADADGKSVEATLAVWQSWYASKFPGAPPATPPTTSVKNKWSYEELAGFLQSPHGTAGSAHRGAAIFKTAQCSLCHRFGSAGEGIGPDLTTVSKRFHTKEILESVLYPSHVISDQYESKVVVANGRQIIGLVAPDGENAIAVLQQDGTTKRLFKDDIEEIVESKQSTMPDGLLNALTLDQVADLLAYLRTVPQTATANAADRDEPVRR